MDINNIQSSHTMLHQNQQLENNKSRLETIDNNKDDQKLKETVNQFSAILLKMMFKSMRNTLSDDNKYIDGGFAQDVFTDMIDDEISQEGSKQNTFKNLNNIMYNQLKQE